MDILSTKKDIEHNGEVMLRAGVAYFPKKTETVKGRECLVYDTEIKGLEYLILIK